MYGKFYLVYFTFLGVTPAYVHRTRKSPDLELKYEMCCVCVCVCVFIKLHITAQPGLVILVIICHSR